jgi:hypothetical protein
MNLESKNVDVAFYDLEKDEKVPVAYQLTSCHMIFDVKILQEGIQQTLLLQWYTQVVSAGNSVRIVLLIAALNNLPILAADTQKNI